MDVEGLQPKQFFSEILNCRRSIVGWRPRQAGVDEPLPTLYLLHGMHGFEWDWIVQGRAPQTLQRLVDEGALPAMMLVTINDGLEGQGTGYVNWARSGKRYEDSFVSETIAFVDTTWATIGTRESRWIGGLSMGGFGATHLAWNHPELVSRMLALSSVFDARFLERHYGGPVMASEAARDAHSPLLMVEHLADEAKLPFYVACGSEDHLIAQNRAMAERLQATSYPCHTYEESPGAHTWDFWERHLETGLRWLGSR